MTFKTTIQLIKLNLQLPKDELSNGNNYFGLKGIGKFAHDLFINTFISKKKKTTINMRLFDGYDPTTQIDILTKSVQWAKREIADNGNPTNRSIEDVATDYTHQDGVIIADYTRVTILTIPAWTGPVPIKFPRP